MKPSRGLPWAAFALLLALVAGCSPTAQHPDDPAIRAHLERYFLTWSARDMTGYGACFHPNARVTFVSPDGEAASQGLTDFLHSQKMSHAQAAFPMSEVPISMRITGDARVAQAAVNWRLTKGTETVTGLDYFTLLKTRDGWRIIALVFYND